MRRWAGIALLSLGLGLAGPGAVPAATPSDADSAAIRLAEAERALDAASNGAGTATDLADAIARYDRALADVRSAVIRESARESEIRVGLARDSQEISALLATLERVSLGLDRRLRLHPQGPLAAARARMMAEALVPGLAAEADTLRARLDEIAEVRRHREAGVALIAAGLERLAAARSQLVAHMQFVRETGRAVDARMAEALGAADSLADLSSALGKGAPPVTDHDGPRRPWMWPVDSDVLRAFNARDAAGVRWPGIVLDAPPLSLVRAPADADVRYAGPFLDYRGIVVLRMRHEPALVVIAGLAELNVRSGDFVARGAPLGMLGGRSPGVEEYVMPRDLDSGSGLGEALYVEIRHGRGPVDPVSWFDGSNG